MDVAGLALYFSCDDPERVAAGLVDALTVTGNMGYLGRLSGAVQSVPRMHGECARRCMRTKQLLSSVLIRVLTCWFAFALFA
jgi:hypothetical protein